MADKPGSYGSNPKVSRHTMVIRKAKEDDERRLAEADDAVVRSGGQTRVLSSSRRSTPPPQQQREESGGEPRIQSRERTVSGRTVLIRREGTITSTKSMSTRLSGSHASSVRVAGGDTIIRYQSGDMVIMRGTRRAVLRRQIIWAYALGYLVLFGVYGYFLLTGTYSLTPHEFIEKAFPRRRGTGVLDLERAAFRAMRGNRTPAEVRLAENLSFYDGNKDLIRITAGDRLTLPTAAKLGQAVLEDEKRPEDRRSFAAPLRLYKETYLASVEWPHLLTLYNALGFFLLLLLFLWRPIMNYLGTQGKKTAVALRNARQAQDEALAYRNRYRDLAHELETGGDRMRGDVEAKAGEEREAALALAHRQAEGIAGGIEDALDNEARETAARLGVRAAVRACDAAKRLLEERLGPEEHDAAVDQLIADISAMRFS